MAWGYLTVQIVPADMLARTTVGAEEGLTRDEAHGKILAMLDAVPALAPIAKKWAAGAKDDTVYAGLTAYTIFEYGPGGLMAAAGAWVKDYAETVRSAGVDVQIAQFLEKRPGPGTQGE